jgi:ABC-2 type transport system permease protein
MVWGNLTLYLQNENQATNPHFSQSIVFLIGAVILWDVMFRAQQGVAISFLEDVWTRNLLNIFVAPVRTAEYVGATFTVGFLRICVTVMVLSVMSAVGYHFNIFSMNWGLIPFFANLLVFGWALGMISTALILRWGQAVESLAWAIPFFLQPMVAAFYPVSKLPHWLQSVSWCFPATYVFEGMRDVLDPKIGGVNWNLMLCAILLNLVYLGFASFIFHSMLQSTRKRGLLTKFATQ